LWESSSIASFCLTNAIYSITKDLLDRGIIKEIPYAMNVLYGIHAAISLYALLFEYHTLPDSWKLGLLPKMAGGQNPQHYQSISDKFTNFYKTK